jgi:hemoglobin
MRVDTQAGVPNNRIIGPVFESKVHDWEAHIARLCTFWSFAVLMSGRCGSFP